MRRSRSSCSALRSHRDWRVMWTLRYAPVLLMVWSIAACSDEPRDPGEEAYLRYCALCHGDQGQGYLTPRANALSNPHFLAASSDNFLRVGVVQGRPGTKMSAWGQAYGGPLSDAEADAIVTWLRGRQTLANLPLDESPLQGDVASGVSLWSQSCGSCHGDKGQGGSAMSVTHPVFLASASDGFLRASIALGRPGTAMPAYESQLTQDQIDSLVRAIRSMEAAP